jgi:hypothetical protein
LIGGILRHIDVLDAEIAALDDAIEKHLSVEQRTAAIAFARDRASRG